MSASRRILSMSKGGGFSRSSLKGIFPTQGVGLKAFIASAFWVFGWDWIPRSGLVVVEIRTFRNA